MGRPGRGRALVIWSNGVRIGRWIMPARGETELQYDTAWVESSSGRPLSLSLPFSRHNGPLKGAPVFNYFDNLLPDSDAIRRRVAERFRADSTEVFDLLAAVGRDCVGAVQLLPEGEAPSGFDRIEGVPHQQALDLPYRHAPGVHGHDPLIEALEAPLMLRNQDRLEAAFPVPGHLDMQRPVLGQHRFGALAVTVDWWPLWACPARGRSPSDGTAPRSWHARSAPS